MSYTLDIHMYVYVLRTYMHSGNTTEPYNIARLVLQLLMLRLYCSTIALYMSGFHLLVADELDAFFFQNLQMASTL